MRLGTVQETLLIPLYGRALDAQARHPILRDDGACGMVEDWGLRLRDSRTFATAQPDVARTWPWRHRYGMPLLARLVPPAVNSYRMNLFALEKGQ